MKRFTLFFFALLACLVTGNWQSAWAQTVVTKLDQLSNEKVYNIKSVRGYLLYSANYSSILAGSAGSGVKDAGTASSTQAAQQFAIYTVGGKHYLYSVGAKKFVSSNGNYEDSPNTVLTITATNNKDYPWMFKLGSSTINMQDSNKGGDAKGCLVNGWATADDGNRLAITEATLASTTDISTPLVPLLQKVYADYVAQIKAAAGLKFFYHDASDAISKLPAKTPTTKAELEKAINNLQTAIESLNAAEGVLGTDLDGKTVFLGNLLHAKMYVGTQVKDGKNVLGSDESGWQLNHAWTFEKTAEGTYYIKNAATGLYIGAIPGENNACVPLCADKAEAQAYSVEYAGKNGYCNIYVKDGEKDLNALHMVDWNGVVRWSTTANASKFRIEEAADILAVYNKYYTIKVSSAGYLSLKDGNVVLNGSSVSGLNYCWHVVKMADGTYRFINASVAGKVLGMTGSEENARATMQSPALTNWDDTYATYFNGSIKIDGSGVSNVKIANSDHNYWNKRGDYLALWNDSRAGNGGDAGSNFMFEEVQPTNDILYAEYNTVEAGKRPTDVSKYTLWYNVPVAKTGVSDTWMEYALPLGNGQLGTTIRGGIFKDELQFNEKTLWKGGTNNGGGEDNSRGWYQNFGSILVTDMSDAFSYENGDKPVKEYVRYLDIMNGVGGVNYKSSDEATTYARRYFTSATDKVLVAHYEAKGTDKLNMKVTFKPDALIGAGNVTYENGGATFSGKMAVVMYNAAYKVVANEGAKVTTGNDGIRVENAEWVNVLLAAATDYDATKAGCKNGQTAEQIAATVQERLTAAAAKDYATLLKSHTDAFGSYMNRADLDIAPACTDKTTEDLLKFYNQSAENKKTDDAFYLESLYFQYGRYMTVAANLDGSIHAPSNLQGIWNDRSNTDFWHCDIHADINVQMNYWPADPTNLSEMHLPFLYHIIDLASAPNSPWVALAQKIKSGAPGWTVAVENNIMGGTSTWFNGQMKTLGAWYCDHLWRYYKYTLDRDFLKKALPVMYQNALFTKSISTKDSKGLYEIKNEWSPEHGNADVTAFAQQTAYQALDDLFKGHKELGSESPLTDDQMSVLTDLYNNFDKGIWTETYEGKTCISEWKNNALDDQGHRHLSHLMCLYPFAQVSAFDTTTEGQKFFEAAYNGQIARNGDVTGWSMGWQTNTYARCLDGDKAHYNLQRALRHSGAYNIVMAGQGGCYYNLFDSHSPFQIDGNYGCTSGVAEMLLQSYDDVITILPALPSAWPNGSVKGLKAQGNYNVDEEWTDGKATSAKVTNNLQEDRTVKVRYNNIVKAYDIKAGETLELDFTNGLPTAIATITNGVKAQKSIFDLSGRRVSKTAKGVYIVDGQKVIF